MTLQIYIYVYAVRAEVEKVRFAFTRAYCIYIYNEITTV